MEVCVLVVCGLLMFKHKLIVNAAEEEKDELLKNTDNPSWFVCVVDVECCFFSTFSEF